ncbi:hypothetical protein BJY01DRAFT_207560 [Aspergillus pseudoustus]|uniref:Uncharacterized protein n=1 Tax=Aspergillus pseudoustus TaxID=1810923 RepID=A0ABR4KKZ0_9EURO
MDVLLSKKTALKRRASLSLLFGSQKPTFATLNDKPTRYYDFVDAPALHKPSSTLIDRQDIPPELESKIKYACSLLAYRIDQGVLSPPKNQIQRSTTRTGLAEHIPAKAQLDSKYPVSKTGTQTGYDSGVGLTQQPSMQTMRVLHSRSGDASDAGDTTTVSIFSNSNTRTGTSCSNTSVINSTTQSPKQNGDELQSMTGANILGCSQDQDRDKKAFLTELSHPLSSHPVTNANIDDSTPNDDAVEVFLNPNTAIAANFSSETLSSHPSPSLGLSRVPANQYQPSNLRDSYQAQYQEQELDIIGLGATYTKTQFQYGRSRSIIIDSDGRARLLTPDEETQRNKALQQAVLAKMSPGFMKYNPIPNRQPSARQKRESAVPAVRGEENNGDKTRSRFSRLGFMRSFHQTDDSSMGMENGNGSTSGSTRNSWMRKLRSLRKEGRMSHQKERGSSSVLKKVGNFFTIRDNLSPT